MSTQIASAPSTALACLPASYSAIRPLTIEDLVELLHDQAEVLVFLSHADDLYRGRGIRKVFWPCVPVHVVRVLVRDHVVGVDFPKGDDGCRVVHEVPEGGVIDCRPGVDFGGYERRRGHNQCVEGVVEPQFLVLFLYGGAGDCEVVQFWEASGRKQEEADILYGWDDWFSAGLDQFVGSLLEVSDGSLIRSNTYGLSLP